MAICRAALAVLVLVLAPSITCARVIHVEISSRRDVLNGQSFGTAGPYERITGRVYFTVDIGNAHNSAIVDLKNAANLKNGSVEFSSDFALVRPKDPARGNGGLLLEIPNRGRARIISLVDGGDWDLSHGAGDAWLLRNGYSVASLGWQWDATGQDALHFYAPVAKENGKTIHGLLRGDLMLAHPANEIPLGHLILGNVGGSEYPVSDPDDPRNVLTVRDSPTANRVPIPRSDWRFARTVDGKLQPDNRYIYLRTGFQPGRIYEYVYVVADPVVAGLGFAAVRDFATYAKTAEGLVAAHHVYGEGISQNGRFLRDFLYEGFNADEEGKMALDGVLAHVAGAGRGSFNYRFAQPSRDAQPTLSLFFPTDIFPFTDTDETDPLTGAKGGLLDRAKADGVTPKIFLSNTSYEYWSRAASLIHTSADGMRDAPISPQVRVYHFTGLQHFSVPFPPTKGQGDLKGQQPESPLPIQYFWRAMIRNMDRWVTDGTAPPESSYPRIENGTLVPLARYALPHLPGIRLPHDTTEGWRLDFGPNWQRGILTKQPPAVGKPFPALVPQVDADGNEKDGVRLPEITVPLATYTGWNLRDPSIGAADQRISFEGSYLPLPRTDAERKQSVDPRKSIAERYKDRDDYLARAQSAIKQLIAQRWILEEDGPALLKRCEMEWNTITAATPSAALSSDRSTPRE